VLGRLLSVIAPPLCAACGGDAGRAAPLCVRCRARLVHAIVPAPREGDRVWAAFPYDGPAGALVRALKYGGRIAVADVMAAQLAAGAPPGLVDGSRVLVPVPLHRARRRRRGFNHARALADALASRTDLGVADCLERAGDAGTQVGKGRRQRIAAMRGRIGVRAGAAVPERVVLVDDVVTTGATLAACAEALRAAGCREVAAVAYARTPGR
jgi:ComF family protein